MQRCQSEGKGCCDMIKGPTSWMACGSAWWDGGDGGDEDKSECPAWRLSIYENDVQLCKQARYHKKRERIKGMEVLTFKALPRGASLVFPFAMTTKCDTNQPHAQHLLRGQPS